MKRIKPITLEENLPEIEATGDLQEQIRRRAYELYEQRGAENGHELEDWLQAEAEVKQSMSKLIAA